MIGKGYFYARNDPDLPDENHRLLTQITEDMTEEQARAEITKRHGAAKGAACVLVFGCSLPVHGIFAGRWTKRKFGWRAYLPLDDR